MTTIPLKYDPGTGSFPIPRLFADVYFEPANQAPTSKTFYENAFVDTGAPYLILPHSFHSSGSIKVCQHHGKQLYRVRSMGGAPVLQSFATVEIRFLVNTQEAHARQQVWSQLTNQPAPAALGQSQKAWSYEPGQPLEVQAYLLEPRIPPGAVVIGLKALHDHFIFVMVGDMAFLLPRTP